MLFVHQMNMCQKQSTETALNLLINQIHEIWQNKNHVISLLFLNIIKVYDCVIHSRMMHVLWVKKISEQLTEWMQAFMINRILILMLLNIEIKKINICWNIIRIFFISHFLFVLCDEASEDIQQHQKSAKCKYFHEWYHIVDLWANYWKKLQNSWKCT